jgi:aspartyl-tRNA(Asn)/glutamyl-tRNA(Gln) amidotransferase subunit A
MNLTRLSARELIEGYSKRTFSPVEVLNEVLELLARVDPKTNAFLAVNEEDARIAARSAEKSYLEGSPAGLLCGVPISVKDSIEVSGMPTTYGSVAFRDNMQPDAELVVRLRNQGALIIGKTNLPEFALRPETYNNLRDPGRNPWDLSRTCGGSSGGAGVAVAVGIGPIAIGTDSGGSIRGPSAQNGIFGLKPSFQRIPAVQTWRASWNRSHNGPMTRTLFDAALLMDAIAGPDKRDQNSQFAKSIDFRSAIGQELRKIRIGIAPNTLSADDGNEVRQAIDAGAELLRKAGHTVVEVPSLPIYKAYETREKIWPYSGDHFAAAEQIKPNFLEQHVHELTEYAKTAYINGPLLPAWEYRLALNHDDSYRREMNNWLESQDVDVVLMNCISAAPVIGPDGRATDKESNGLAMFNVSRLPVALVPAGFFSKSQVPFGIQVVGHFGHDDDVMGVAAIFEKAGLWNNKWPEI